MNPNCLTLRDGIPKRFIKKEIILKEKMQTPKKHAKN